MTAITCNKCHGVMKPHGKQRTIYKCETSNCGRQVTLVVK